MADTVCAGPGGQSELVGCARLLHLMRKGIHLEDFRHSTFEKDHAGRYRFRIRLIGDSAAILRDKFNVEAFPCDLLRIGSWSRPSTIRRRSSARGLDAARVDGLVLVLVMLHPDHDPTKCRHERFISDIKSCYL